MLQTSKTFRIFVSSTFSDLKEERNALQQYVFPRLRKLCMQHGCRFQAIDLRWGVSEEASRDQQAMKICLEEIKRCQRVTPRPNFLVLLGDRYGWRPLPAEIPASEFDLLLSHVTDPDDKVLLTDWYQRDDNAVPAVYCLQPRTGDCAEYAGWQPVERRLHLILRNAAAEIALPPDEEVKYTASATEQEIVRGALNVPQTNEHVFCFFRQITNRNDLINDLPHSDTATDFIDVDANRQPDQEAFALLSDLKRRLRDLLPQNIHEYKDARWNGSGVTTDHIGNLPEQLADCLQLIEDGNAPKTLCVDVWRRLARVILDEVKKIKSTALLDKEIEDHLKFGEERGQQFIGREDVLESIQRYLNDNNNQPLVIYGKSGSGKTALMAKAIADCESLDKKPIFRFIGATPSSSEIRLLLESLCQQVGIKFGEKRTTPSEYQELVNDFRIRLALADADRPLIIFLDALDQLGLSDNAYSLNWLPRKLPPHAKLIVSILEAEGTAGECLASAQKVLSPDNFVELGPLSAEHGEQLLDAWLKESGRTLELKQRQEVMSKFANCPLPLYLKLAFNEARVWKSYDPPLHLSENITGILSDLFTRLEKETIHGHLFVSRSLGYLSASRHGLTEDEMVAGLSADQEVLKDFHRRSLNWPEIDSLPVVIWSRLYFDLEPYLTERRADNTSLLSFYHRQVGDVIAERYLKGKNEHVIRAKLADFFEKQLLGPRQVSELPWQLVKIASQESWQRLNDLLSDLPFFEEAWNSSVFDVEVYWAKVEKNSSFRLLEAYQPIVNTPEHYSESIIWSVASLFAETGHPLEGLSLRRHLVAHYLQTHNTGQLSEALGNLSVSLHLVGELDEALKLLKLQEDICRQLNHLEGLANCLGNQAQILHTRGLLDEAMVKVKEQEQLSNQLRDRGGLCRAYSTQGLILHSQGKLDEALALFQREEELAKEIGDIKQLSISFGNQARIHMLRGE